MHDRGFSHFHQKEATMQPQAILRRSHLRHVTGLSLATIDRMIARNEFPQPLRLSTQAVGWTSESIDAWIATLQPKTTGA